MLGAGGRKRRARQAWPARRTSSSTCCSRHRPPHRQADLRGDRGRRWRNRAHTAHEHTAFYARVPASLAQVGLDLLADVVTTPAFDVDDVESERQVILEELHLAEDEGDDRDAVAGARGAVGRAPARERGAQFARVHRRHGPGRHRRFFEQHYHPSNLVLVAAGGIDHRRVVEAGSGSRPTPAGPVVPIGQHQWATCRRRPRRCCAGARAGAPGRGVARVPADGPGSLHALSVCNQILGGGLSSRLFQEIREERGLAYSVFSSVSSYSDAGSVVAYAGTSPDRVGEVHRLIVDTTAELVAHGVTHREWEVARGYLEGAALLSLEDSGSVMARLGNHVCARGTVSPLEVQLAKLRAVTPDDVHRVAQRLLAHQPAVCAVGPLKPKSLA
ncbi:MAG: pitrilysin family protein [Acidimicrobiales bacterium]